MRKRILISIVAVVLTIGFDHSARSGEPQAGKSAKTDRASKPNLVTVVDLEEVRKTSNDGFPQQGLTLLLSVSEYKVDLVKDVECTLIAASDDSGRDLIKREKGFFDRTEFRPDENSDRFEVKVKLRSPLRKATTIKVEGTLDLFVPTDDPAAIIVVKNVVKLVAKPLESDALKAVDASVVVSPRLPRDEEENDVEDDTERKDGTGGTQSSSGRSRITLKIIDPEEKIKGIEFFSSKGKRLKETENSGESDGTVTLRRLGFASALPENAEMRIYVETPQSLRKLPFSFQDVVLP